MKPQTAPPAWIATDATVTTCRYTSPALRAMAFGMPSGKNFRITFDYYAHGTLYSDEFQSATAIPQNTVIPVTYNPLDPQQNSYNHKASAAGSSQRQPMLLIGIAGSIVLSLAWLAVLRGCH